MSARDEAEKIQGAANAFHTWHSSRTWNAGHPEIDKWLRDVLVSLQSTLYTIAEAEKAMAAQIDQNTAAIREIQLFLNRRG